MKFDFDFQGLVADPRTQTLKTREDKERLRENAFRAYVRNNEEFAEWFVGQSRPARRQAFAEFERQANEATPDFWTYEAQPARTGTIRQQGIEMQMYIPVADTGGRSPMLPWDQEYIYNFLKDIPKDQITGIDRETLQFYAGIASTRGDEFAGVNEWVKESLEEQAGPNAQVRLVAGNVFAFVTQVEKAMAWVAGKAFDAIGHRYTDDISNQVTPFATREQFEAMEQLYPVSSVVGSMAGILGSALAGYGILQAGTLTTNAFRAGQIGLRFFNGKMILGYAGINSAISLGYMEVAPGLIASVLDRPDSIPLNLVEGLMLGMVFDLGIDAARTLVGVSGRQAIRKVKEGLSSEDTLRLFTELFPDNAEAAQVLRAVELSRFAKRSDGLNAEQILAQTKVDALKDVIFGPEGMSRSQINLHRRVLAERIRAIDPASQLDSSAPNFLEQVAAFGIRNQSKEITDMITTIMDPVQWSRVVKDAALKPINTMNKMELMAMSVNHPPQQQYIEAVRRMAAGDGTGPVNVIRTESGDIAMLSDAQYIAAFDRNPKYFVHLYGPPPPQTATLPVTPEVIKPSFYKTLDEAIGARIEFAGEEGILIRTAEGDYAMQSGNRIIEIPNSLKDGTKSLSDLGVEPVAARFYTNPTVDAEGVIIRGTRYAKPTADNFALDDTGRIISVTLEGPNGPRTFRDPAVAGRLADAILDRTIAREAPEAMAEALARSPDTPGLQSIEGMIHPMTKQVMGVLNRGESVLPDGRILGGTPEFSSQTADILSTKNISIARSNLNSMIDRTIDLDITEQAKDRAVRILQDKLKALDDYESGKLYPSGVRSGDPDTTSRLNKLREIANSLKPDTLARIERGELGELGVPELRRVARLFGIPRSSKLKKADLVSSIDARLERVFQPRELRMRDFSGGPALPEEVSRYNEILRLLPEDVSFSNLQKWKLDNPDLYRELREIRERVLDRAGYNNAAFHGTKKPGFVTFSFDKLGDNTGAQSARLAFFGTSSPEVAHFYAGQKALNDRLDALLSKIFKGGSMDRVSGAFDALTTQSKHFDDAIDDLLDISNGIKKAHSMTLNPVGIVEQYLDGLNGFLKILDPEISSGFSKIIKSAQDTLGRKARALQKLAGDAPEKLERDFLLKRVMPLMDSILLDMLDASRALRRQTDALIDKISIQEFGAEKIMDLRFGFKNPKVIDMNGGRYTDISISKSIRDAMAEGHDGLILRNFIDPDPASDHFIAFHPGQIKSADPLTVGPDGRILGLNDLGGTSLSEIEESLKSVSDIVRVLDKIRQKPLSDEISSAFQYWFSAIKRTPLHDDAYSVSGILHGERERWTYGSSYGWRDVKNNQVLKGVNHMLGWSGLPDVLRRQLTDIKSTLEELLTATSSPDVPLGVLMIPERYPRVTELMDRFEVLSKAFRETLDEAKLSIEDILALRIAEQHLPEMDSRVAASLIRQVATSSDDSGIIHNFRAGISGEEDIRKLPARSWKELEPTGEQGGIEQRPMFSKKIPTSVMDDLTAPSRTTQLQGEAFNDFTLATREQIQATEQLNQMFPNRVSQPADDGLDSFLTLSQIEALAARGKKPKRITKRQMKEIFKQGVRAANTPEGTVASTVIEQAAENPRVLPNNAAPQIDHAGVAKGDIQSLINMQYLTRHGYEEIPLSGNTLFLPKIPEGATAFEHALGAISGLKTNTEMDEVARAIITGKTPRRLRKRVDEILDNKEWGEQFLSSRARNDLRRIGKLIDASENPDKLRADLLRYLTGESDSVRGTLPANIEDIARRLKQQRMDNSIRISEIIRQKSGEPDPFIQNLETYLHRGYRAYIGDPQDWMDYVKRTPSPNNPNQTIWEYTREWVAKNWNDHLIRNARETLDLDYARRVAEYERWLSGGKKGRALRRPRASNLKEFSEAEIRAMGGLVNPKAGEPSLIDQAGYILEQYLNRDSVLDYMLGTASFNRQSRGIIKSRVNVPPVIREFLGEVTDPLEAMGASLFHQRRLIEQFDSQQMIRDILIDSKIASTIPSEGKVALAGESVVPGKPLSGLFVPPEIKEMLVNASVIDAEALSSVTYSFWRGMADAYLGFAGFAKAGVTVYSPRGYFSNGFGSFGNFAQQGHLNIYDYVRSVGTAGEMTDTFAAKAIPSQITEPEVQLAVDALTGVGGFGQSIGVRSFMESVNRIRASAPGTLKRLREIEKHVLKHWSVADDASKIAAFLGENRRYRHLKDTRFGGDEVAYARWLAERVMQTNQDYSRLPKILQDFTSIDIGATPFLNFKYDQFRIAGNTARIIFSDLTEGIATGDWRLVSAAAQRFAAYTLLGVGIPAVKFSIYGGIGLGGVYTARDILEGDNRPPEMVRDVLVPEWLSPHTTAVMGWDAKEGTFTTMDLTFTFPAANVTRFMLEVYDGLRNGDTALERGLNAANRVFTEFVGLGYMTPSIIEALSNRDEYGRKLTEEEGIVGFFHRLGHVAESVNFTGVKDAQAVWGVLSDDMKTGSFGDRVTTTNLLAFMAGQRTRTTHLPSYVESIARQAAFNQRRSENPQAVMLVPARGAAAMIWARENKGFSPVIHSDSAILERLQNAGWSRSDSEQILRLGYSLLEDPNLVGQ
jgi:hypothetical protein